MPTDVERREVARKLRGIDFSDVLFDSELVDAIEHVCGSKRKRRDFVKIVDRLADLIEPSPSCEFWDAEEQECYSIRTVQPVDRDALMALAEEMVEMLRLGAFTGEGLDAKWCRELHDSYGRRIRKACGEEAKDES